MIYSFNGIDNLLGTSSRQWRARSDQILSKNRTERSAHCYCTVPLSNRLKQPHSSRLFHPVDKKEDINLHVTRATNLSICRVCVLPPPAFNHTTNSQSQRGKMCPIYKQTFYSPPSPKALVLEFTQSWYVQQTPQLYPSVPLYCRCKRLLKSGFELCVRLPTIKTRA